MKNIFMYQFFLLFITILFVSCAKTENTIDDIGTLNNKCFDNDTCREDLICIKMVCEVRPPNCESGCETWQECIEGDICAPKEGFCDTNENCLNFYICDKDHLCIKDLCESEDVSCGDNSTCNYLDAKCICNEGFILDENENCIMDLCKDIECQENAECSMGTCICNEGFTLNEENKCIEKNACDDITCGKNASCKDAVCSCNEGFSGDPNTTCLKDGELNGKCINNKDCNNSLKCLNSNSGVFICHEECDLVADYICKLETTHKCTPTYDGDFCLLNSTIEEGVLGEEAVCNIGEGQCKEGLVCTPIGDTGKCLRRCFLNLTPESTCLQPKECTSISEGVAACSPRN